MTIYKSYRLYGPSYPASSYPAFSENFHNIPRNLPVHFISVSYINKLNRNGESHSVLFLAPSVHVWPLIPFRFQISHTRRNKAVLGTFTPYCDEPLNWIVGMSISSQEPLSCKRNGCGDLYSAVADFQQRIMRIYIKTWSLGAIDTLPSPITSVNVAVEIRK